ELFPQSAFRLGDSLLSFWRPRSDTSHEALQYRRAARQWMEQPRQQQHISDGWFVGELHLEDGGLEQHLLHRSAEGRVSSCVSPSVRLECRAYAQRQDQRLSECR